MRGCFPHWRTCGNSNPDAVVIRHVLEHLTDLGKLLGEFAWGAHVVGKAC